MLVVCVYMFAFVSACGMVVVMFVSVSVCLVVPILVVVFAL